MKFVPYLTFDGNCREAFDFYAELFGGTITGIMTYGEMPESEKVPPALHERIVNVQLVAGEQELMGSDAYFPYVAPTGITISIQLDDDARAETIFNALAAGGTIVMPFAPTFWARKFGIVTDRFGTPWMINCGMVG